MERLTSTNLSFTPIGPSFARRDGDVETRWAVCVVPDADCEVRAVTLVNHGSRPRELELTSFAEVCLNHRRADQAHPAFAKLFLETEFDAKSGAFWSAAGHGVRTRIRSGRFTSRHAAFRRAEQSSTRRIACSFLGRGRTSASPAALDSGARLSQTTGPVLDPVFSLRRRVRLEPEGSVRVAFVTGAAETREAALKIAERFRDPEAIDRAFDGAKTGVRTSCASCR